MTTFATDELNKYDARIAQVEEQIQQLQQLLSQQQSERQNIQSIEQMGTSAIAQMQKTLAACNHADLPQLAESFKQQVLAALNDSDLPELPAADAVYPIEAPVIIPPTPQTPSADVEDLETGLLPESKIISDNEILEVIKTLDEKHGTDNYLPIYLYRTALHQLTRKEQDHALYRLMATDRIELSTLQEVRSYTVEQVEAGIPQDIGGRLFFIVVENKERRSLSKPIATTSVGAAAATDIALMDFNQLKTYCLETKGLNKDDIRKHGKLTRRDTWVSALNELG